MNLEDLKKRIALATSSGAQSITLPVADAAALANYIHELERGKPRTSGESPALPSRAEVDESVRRNTAEHAKLTGIAMQLSAAVSHAGINGAADRSVVLNLAEHAIEAFQAHFAAEEAAMAQLRYPAAAKHQASHAAMMQKLMALCDPTASRSDLTRAASAIQGWLNVHILTDDESFTNFVRSAT